MTSVPVQNTARRVLVVDDEFDMSGTLRVILEGLGYKVSTCSNGREAVECLKAAQPDLVILDVMMPLQGGLEALKVIRKTPGLEGLPVVLMSAAPEPPGDGWQAFLRKPFGLDQLTTVVKQYAG